MTPSHKFLIVLGEKLNNLKLVPSEQDLFKPYVIEILLSFYFLLLKDNDTVNIQDIKTVQVTATINFRLVIQGKRLLCSVITKEKKRKR